MLASKTFDRSPFGEFVGLKVVLRSLLYTLPTFDSLLKVRAGEDRE